jgi:hypothetical protein
MSEFTAKTPSLPRTPSLLFLAPFMTLANLAVRIACLKSTDSE